MVVITEVLPAAIIRSMSPHPLTRAVSIKRKSSDVETDSLVFKSDINDQVPYCEIYFPFYCM